MKKHILSLLVAIGLVGSASAQTTLFQDDFSGTSVDTTKWTVNTFGNGSVEQSGNGFLSLNHTGYSSKANITTKTEFNQPFTISGGFNISANAGSFSVITRSSGETAGYGDPAGLNFIFYNYTGLGINNVFVHQLSSSIYYNNLVAISAAFNPDTLNSFSITDDSSSVSISLNGVSLGSWAVDPNFSIGRNISVTDEGNWSGGSYNSSYVGPVTVSSVPEPSTYALFGLGAIGMLIVMRRKKTA